MVAGCIATGFMSELLPGPMAVALLALAVLLAQDRFWGAWLLGGAALGLAWGVLHGHWLLDSRLAGQCEATPLWVEGVISSLPRRSRTSRGVLRARFELRPTSIEPSFCEGPRRLLLSYYGDLKLHPGEYWRFRVKLKKPWGLANPGSFNMQAWYAYSGIDGTGNVKAGQAILLRNATENGLNHHALRQHISEGLNRLGLSDDVRGILQALTVADKSGINSSLWTLLQFYGINHLLVISGLHIGIVSGAGYMAGAAVSRIMTVAGAVRIAGVFPLLMALLCGTGYAALAGFSVATVRALCMLGCFVVASLFARGSLSADKLLIAAVIVLLANPLSAIGSGFWLSFSAVAALLWLGMWRVNARLPLRLVHTHIYMALAMIPLGGWWFGGVSQVSALANFFLLPLVGFFVVPVALLAVVTQLLELGVDHHLWATAAWPLEQLLPYARDLAQNRASYLYSYLSPSPTEVMLALAALALLPIPLPAMLRVLVPILALPIFLPTAVSQASATFHTRLTFLDVGQGTSVVIQSGGNTLVYDTGGGDPKGSNMANRVVLPYLREQGVNALHTLMISHPDNDHSAGAVTLINALPIEQLIVGGERLNYPDSHSCRAGEAWRWASGISFQVLSPEPGGELSSNNSSCVLQVHIGELSVLLPGDIDSRREKDLVSYWRDSLRSDVLLAAHHGSLSSSSYPWLKTIQPGIAVFSHGYLNQFGHPRSKIMARYTQIASQHLSSAAQGAVQIDISRAGEIVVASYRASRRRYWM